MYQIHIIESPHEDELLSGRQEGKALTEALRLAEAKVSYRLATSSATFERALSQVADAYVVESSEPEPMPFVHVSAHGDADGIFLTNGERFSWSDFADALDGINEKIGGHRTEHSESTGLIHRVSLCFSSCHGFSAVQIHDGGSCPYAFIVGPLERITWPDSLTAYQAFYNGLLRGASIPELVNRMNAAIAFDSGFQWTMSPAIEALRE